MEKDRRIEDRPMMEMKSILRTEEIDGVSDVVLLAYYIGPHIKVLNRLVKAIFNKVSNIVDERKIASGVRLPDHSSNDVSSTSLLLKSNEAVFLNPNNKDVSTSLQTVVEKLGCSKLDENDLDDSVFEIEDEELSDEEIIVDEWALAE